MTQGNPCYIILAVFGFAIRVGYGFMSLWSSQNCYRFAPVGAFYSVQRQCSFAGQYICWHNVSVKIRFGCYRDYVGVSLYAGTLFFFVRKETPLRKREAKIRSPDSAALKCRVSTVPSEVGIMVVHFVGNHGRGARSWTDLQSTTWPIWTLRQYPTKMHYS